MVTLIYKLLTNPHNRLMVVGHPSQTDCQDQTLGRELASLTWMDRRQ